MEFKSLVYKGHPPHHCCCDQTVRRLKNGELAVFFMTGGDREPRKENFVAMCRSTDEGRTWGELEVVKKYEDHACLLSEVFVKDDGEIVIFMQTHGGHFNNWRVFTLCSEDNGHSWKEPEEFKVMPRRSFIRNFVETSWGELLLPFQNYDYAEDWTASPMRDGTSKKGAYNGVLISTDSGKSWTVSKQVGPVRGWAENNVIELSDGKLVMLCRADGTGYLLRSESTDKGRTWSAYEKTDIPNPGSKFRLFKLKNGKIGIVHNPNAKCGDRNPLALWISDDDMKTWSVKRLITDFPGRLQYPDGFYDEKENCLHIVFDYNRHDVIYFNIKL